MTISFQARIFIKYVLIFVLTVLLFSCQEKSLTDFEGSSGKNKIILNADTDSTIFISPDIIIPDKGKVRDTVFSYRVFEKFLESLIKSGRFLFVPLNELSSTFSSDKVIISLRHDIDYDIASSVRFARREHKLGIRGTYYILHTADYYSETIPGFTERNPTVLDYAKKIQDGYKHEIGWHNDLVTLQVVYRIDAGKYLKDELDWFRSNKIKISGTSNHGSLFCYKYGYLNIYFWKTPVHTPQFPNCDSVLVNDQYVKITKFDLSDFGLNYDADRLHFFRMYADVHLVDNKRWHMKTVDWNAIKPGTKLIILFHPALWDSY